MNTAITVRFIRGAGGDELIKHHVQTDYLYHKDDWVGGELQWLINTKRFDVFNCAQVTLNVVMSLGVAVKISHYLPNAVRWAETAFHPKVSVMLSGGLYDFSQLRNPHAPDEVFYLYAEISEVLYPLYTESWILLNNIKV